MYHQDRHMYHSNRRRQPLRHRRLTVVEQMSFVMVVRSDLIFYQDRQHQFGIRKSEWSLLLKHDEDPWDRSPMDSIV
jgi:hypothetical protein